MTYDFMGYPLFLLFREDFTAHFINIKLHRPQENWKTTLRGPPIQLKVDWTKRLPSELVLDDQDIQN